MNELNNIIYIFSSILPYMPKTIFAKCKNVNIKK